MNSLATSLKFKLGFSDGTGNIAPRNPISYPQQASSILNPCPNIELRKKQDLTLIWFDTDLIIDDDRTQQLRKRLHTLNRFVLFYSKVDCLSLYLETSQFERIILIFRLDCAALLPSKWKENNHIVFFHWNNFGDLNSLFQDVDSYIARKFENQRTSGELILDTSMNRSQRDVRNESFRILYYRMYKQILLNTDQCSEEDNAKSELITLCRKRYPTEYADHIQDFENNYQPNDAIQWYTKDSFIYRLINRALRTQDLECLFVLRFYIRDLSRCLLEYWKTWRNEFKLGHFVHLYRGQIVQHSIRCELEQSQGKIVSINGYWSTSLNEQIAKIYGSIGSTPGELNSESILFDIKVDLNASEQILADIKRLSNIQDEEEVLFDLDATLQIESVIEEQENQIPYWRVRMNMVKDNGLACIQKSIDQRRLYDSTGFDQMWSVKPNINPFDALLHLNNLFNYLHRFEVAVLQVTTTEIKQDDAALLNYIQAAELILKVGPKQPLELEQQKILCQATMHLTLSEHLFDLDCRNEFVRLPQRALGMVHFKGGNYSYSIKQWTRIWNENDKTDRFHTMVCCFYLGLTYSKMHQHSKAIEFFQRALIYTDDLPPIFEAQCRMQIGHSIELQAIEIPMCFTSARANYEKALNLYENRIVPTDEAALALCYAIIGNCYFFENPWTDDSHQYYLKAIDVYDAVLLIESPSPMFTQQVRLLLTGILFHIGLHYYKELRLINKAEQCFERIVTYSAEHCPFDSYALAHRYLGQIISLHHHKYEQALDHFQKSVQFYETYTSEDFWELAFCHQWLAITHVKLGTDQLALDHGNKTIDFLTQANLSKPSTTLPGGDLTYFKHITSFQPENEDAAKEQMKNQTLSETYRLLGDIYERKQEMDLALAMYATALDINQHFTPIYQFETVITKNRLKDLYMKMGHKEEAMIHYKNALNLLKHLYAIIEG